jgi:hypothetical protein
MRSREKIGHLTYSLSGMRYALLKLRSPPPEPSWYIVDDEEKSPASARPSIRLWVAVLLSVIALWFVDGLLKPASRRRSFGRK